MPSKTKREEEKEENDDDDDGVVVARLPTPIVVRHRFVNEDGTTTPIETVRDAVRWAKDTEEGGGATKTFDQTVEMSIRLGVNPKRSDMIVRGTCNLPNGTGKKFYVLAFAENEEDRELAKHAGRMQLEAKN